MKKIIRIGHDDNVVVALCPIKSGETVNTPAGDISVTSDIPAGHKIAVSEIKKGSDVIKYSECIGKATSDIAIGDHVHTHNIATGLSEREEYCYSPRAVAPVSCPEGLPDTFMGFKRPSGKVGVRNEIWIIPTVGCVNSIACALASSARAGLRGSVSDVVAFAHPYGCSQMGDDQENTRRILADLINHPNAGGVLVLGLGCENSNIEVLKPYLGSYDKDRVRFLVAQECSDEMAEGLRLIDELIDAASGDVRAAVSVSELIIGLKCGGSDGFSGITANPLTGRFSDYLVAKGGTSVLTEVPEMFGAEKLLMNRCKNRTLFEKTVGLINNFKDYFLRHGQTVSENPSPGNKAGGISTLEDKSLGCTQKSGTSPVCGVLGYGETVSARGLNLLSAPGNDLVATTALAACGAQIVLFTTGRGTPFGSAVPTVKISSNNDIAERKQNWIDFNAGVLLDGSDPDTVAAQLYTYVISVANGLPVRAESSGFRDIAIFKDGVTL